MPLTSMKCPTCWWMIHAFSWWMLVLFLCLWDDLRSVTNDGRVWNRKKNHATQLGGNSSDFSGDVFHPRKWDDHLQLTKMYILHIIIIIIIIIIYYIYYIYIYYKFIILHLYIHTVYIHIYMIIYVYVYTCIVDKSIKMRANLESG